MFLVWLAAVVLCFVLFLADLIIWGIVLILALCASFFVWALGGLELLQIVAMVSLGVLLSIVAVGALGIFLGKVFQFVWSRWFEVKPVKPVALTREQTRWANREGEYEHDGVERPE